MRSAALFAFLSMATVFACANSRTYYAGDGGTDGGGTVTGEEKDSGKKKDTGPGEEEDSGKTPPKTDSSTPTDECAPGDVSGFTPSWTPPTPLNQGACSATQVTQLISCLFDPSANQTTCDAYLQAPANSACISCAITDSAAASYGPMISTGQLVSLNQGGCIARTSNNVTATGCGAKVQAVGQCAEASCDANCPVPDGDDQALVARNDCQELATTTECSTYQTDADCADALLAAASAACADGTTFEDLAAKYVTLFCGN